MKIALLGANGQLGTDLQIALSGHDLIAFTRREFDVCDRVKMSSALAVANPDLVINTTAFREVDLCESRKQDAFAVNTLAVFDMAIIANQVGAKLVHISTDYVLSGDGTEFLDETAVPLPESVYASSKLAGEYIVRNVAERYLLIRTCGLYGTGRTTGKGVAFPELILKKARAGDPIQVVDDQIVTPTWTADLARQIDVMLGADLEGLVHASAGGSCSWYEFACCVLEMYGTDAAIEPTTSQAYNSLAKRPAYSVLENARLENLGLNNMLSWADGLSQYLREKHGVGVLRPS